MDEARGKAVRRRVYPDAFDETGTILPGKIVDVLRRVHEAGFDGMNGLPLAEAHERYQRARAAAAGGERG